jgi:hypothetical protein
MGHSRTGILQSHHSRILQGIHSITPRFRYHLGNIIHQCQALAQLTQDTLASKNESCAHWKQGRYGAAEGSFIRTNR